MTAVTYGITTTARIKTPLDISTSTFDTLIKRLLYAATDFIEKQCGGRRFEETIYTEEIYDGSNRDRSRKEWIQLKNSPVTALTTVQYNVGIISNPSWITFNTDDFQGINDEGIIRFFQRVPRGLQNIRITYTAGYTIDFATNEFDDALHTLPYDLTELCERLVVRAFKKRDSEGKRIEGFADSTITWIEDLTKEDKQVIANYRRFDF